MKAERVSISVVSHLQIDLIQSLLCDLEGYCKDIKIEVILTLNLEESIPFSVNEFTFPIEIIRNKNPMGFAANHNQAFGYATGQYFCVINPDIRLHQSPFIALIAILKDSRVGVVAPQVLDPQGQVEDSARPFPSPLIILRKIFNPSKVGIFYRGDELFIPDWIGGMFLLFPREVFKLVGGFDQRYFLYYEDVDICARLNLLGYKVVLNPLVRVTHYARRSSHHDFHYLYLHLGSMSRFFLSSTYWQLQLQKCLCYLGSKKS